MKGLSVIREPGQDREVQEKGTRRLPSLVLEVVSMVENPTMSVTQLGKVIASDRMLSDRVLRRANSPVHALPTHVESVDYAITLLGFDALRDMVTRIVVNSAFRKLVNTVIHYEDFWNHSISCGVAARILARRFAPANVDDAFVAGLFHDLGFLLLQPEIAEGFSGSGRVMGEPWPVQRTHEEVSAWLVRAWHLGDQIVEAVRWHHDPGSARLNPPLAATVHIADVLSYRLDIGKSPFDSVTTFRPEALEILDVDEDALRPENLREEAKMIRAGIAQAPGFERIVSDLKVALVEALGGFPPRERLTLALYYQEGLSFADIGRVLNIPEQEVSDVHRHALATLSTVIHDRL